ncbi:uncharacterized protein LOC124775721 [Schistocerca piceifrons]|uniref:uncharacterized protein LOC124775721 n=1 Tax=Schistocerca piceifrons TaxID=274613 RepID=UPI001F5EA813|nr:uncharacterized protein LOC124775721 [Schistocerca piceifrons]
MTVAEAGSSPYPFWINKQLVETVMNNGNDGCELTVENFECDSACKEGMSYTSNIFRIVATVSRGESATCEKRSLILKCLQENWEREDLLKDSNLTQIETMMLDEVMPEVHRLLKRVEGEAFRPVAPLCYLTGRSPVPFLAIEDLSPAGFRTADPARPLDYQHCAAVVRTYARLHAASARILKDRPHYKTVFDPKNTVTEQLHQHIGELAHKIFKACSLELTRGEIRLPVILHGDCWKNNFMFTYVDENIKDVRLIDFQVSKVHSGAADLLYFLYTNASEEVHRDHLDTLLADYRGTLVELLRRLGVAAEADCYTLQALAEDMQAGGTTAVWYSAFSCMSITSHKYGAEFEKLFHNTSYSGSVLKDALRNPYSISYLKYLAPIFDKKSLF